MVHFLYTILCEYDIFLCMCKLQQDINDRPFLPHSFVRWWLLLKTEEFLTSSCAMKGSLFFLYCAIHRHLADMTHSPTNVVTQFH